jgi:hypothetical protein
LYPGVNVEDAIKRPIYLSACAYYALNGEQIRVTFVVSYRSVTMFGSETSGKIVRDPSVTKCEVDNVAIGEDFGVEMLHSHNDKNMILGTFLQQLT